MYLSFIVSLNERPTSFNCKYMALKGKNSYHIKNYWSSPPSSQAISSIILLAECYSRVFFFVSFHSSKLSVTLYYVHYYNIL